MMDQTSNEQGTSNSLTAQERRAVRGLIAALSAARKVDPEFPAQTLLTLLMVATRPGQSVMSLGEALEVSGAAASRNVASLGAYKGKGVAGHGLVKAVEDLNDRRFKQVRPTPAGMRFVKALAAEVIQAIDSRPELKAVSQVEEQE